MDNTQLNVIRRMIANTEASIKGYQRNLTEDGHIAGMYMQQLKHQLRLLHQYLDDKVDRKTVVRCLDCNREITDNEFSHNSEVPGYIDVGYDCDKCGISIYLYKVEYIKE